MNDRKEEKGRAPRPPGGRGGRARRPTKRPASPGRYPVELRRKAVQLHVEEGVPLELVAEELGVSWDTLHVWVKRYQEEGEAGLEPRSTCPVKRKTQLPAAVHQAIVDVKRQHPAFGVRRIAQWLRRSLFLPGSAETVRQTLHRQRLIVPPKHKPKRNPPKPRFFERSTPNQMWQSDIFTFRLNNQNAYLIGFIDDYSRYLTGLGVYRGQTAENVLEVYRRAVGVYGVPKEMLTDNGKQYAAWRGKTRFQMEMAKDRIHHIRSAPHHPMTLGKIERFWKTIWEEFLERARFDTFESAVERIGYWVKYYNHQRPHQGIDGLCPADRFFAIQKEVRAAVERGIEANVQEMALRGKPQAPFYMVGRVGEQNVVLQAERGQVRILVDGQAPQGDRDEHGGEAETGTAGVQRPGEVPSGAGVVDGPAAALGVVPGSEHPEQPAQRLAGTGDGGYATGAGAAHPPAGGARADAGPADGETAGAQVGAAGEPDRPVGRESPASTGEAGGVTVWPQAERSQNAAHADGDDAGHLAATRWEPDRDTGGQAPGSFPQNLLPMGSAGVGGNEGGARTGPSGSALAETGRGTDAGGGTETATPAAGGVPRTTVAVPASVGGS
jgi:transposase InsO family protein